VRPLADTIDQSVLPRARPLEQAGEQQPSL